MLQTHLGGVLYLSRTAAKQLTGSRCRHSTSHTYLALTTYFGSRDRGISFDSITEKPRRRQRPQYTFFGEFVRLMEVIQYCRYHTRRAAGRSRYYLAARGILFRNG